MEILKQHAIRILIALTILTCIILFFLFDLHHYFTLENLREFKDKFAAYNARHPVLTVSIYMIIYIVMAALSLPGAAILTLAAGTIFGLIVGTIVVSFASTIGATIAMLVARTLLRNYVQKKFKNQIQTINEKIEKEGAFYLFALRLVPAFPFFVINLVMGLMPMRVFTFAWVSQIGMLAGTIVYVNAGSELAKVNSLEDIVSPGLLISFALLGILPLLLKKVVGIISRKRKANTQSS